MSIPPSRSHPIRDTALRWAVAWCVLGLTCMGSKGTGDVMSLGDLGPIVPVTTTILGALIGSLYALARRRWPAPPAWRRESGDAHGWRTRLAALGYGAVVGGLALGLPTFSVAAAIVSGALTGITAFALPGDADLC